jgi:MFS family permease
MGQEQAAPGLWTVVAAAAVGAAFEWYDFFVFGAVATILATHFFSALPEAEAFVVTLTAFAAGFIARPFGALMFGKLGDSKGRKSAFLATIVLMGAATFAIGLLPSYDQAGLLAPAALVACRVLQGFALGGEYGGAAIYVAEHSAPAHRGRDTGWIQASASLGLILALCVVLATRSLIGEAAFAAWGWRIPFLGSVILIAISIWIRLKLQESPVFLQMRAQGQTERAPLAESFLRWRNLRLVLLALFGIMTSAAVVWYIGYFYAQFFLERVLHVPGQTVSSVMLAVSIVSAFLYLFFAWLSDHVGRKPVMAFGMVLMLAIAFPGFHALTQAANPALAQARANIAVTLYADPGDCALQLDLTGGARQFTSSCDIAKSALATAGVAYTMRDAPGSARVSVAGREIVSPDAHAMSMAQYREARAGFDQRLRAALVAAGYPEQADTARINLLLVAAIITLFMVAATALYGPLAASLVELFPTHIRYTALSLPYHIGTGWFGGLAPAVAFAIMTATGDIYAGLWYPIAVTALALPILLFLVPETRARRSTANLPARW